MFPNRKIVAFFGVMALSSPAALDAATPAHPLGFNRDIRPILTDKCLACHGHDAHTVEGDLRLDLREAAIKPNEEGNIAIVPGDPESSELIKRIFSKDPEVLMPPPDAHKSLEPEEMELLKRWIEEGAEYEAHWAYTPLVRREVPEAGAGWARNPIDRFVARRLVEEKVEPSSEADRVTQIRRLFFDLTGMPPTPDEVTAFVQDASPDAYEKLVDRLLASPRFGERMAIYWLDLVRYADTVGYHGDQDISQSPYRDYVIEAFNANMPYDRFVQEQLAGDLLPDPTIAQRVASGYNRLNQTTEEGGAQAKEYLAIYFADRVRNVSQVFMGATVGCAQCHDHKYDPYTAKDFYALGAFFADIQEKGVYGARKREPMMSVPNREQLARMKELDAQIASLHADLESVREQAVAGQASWEIEARSKLDSSDEAATAWIDDAQEAGGKSGGKWNFVNKPVHSGTKSRLQQAKGLIQHLFTGAKKPVKVGPDLRFYAWVHLDPKNLPKAVMLQFNDGTWDHRAVWGSDEIEYGRNPKGGPSYHRMGALPKAGEWVRLEVEAKTLGLKPDAMVNGMAFTQFGGKVFWDDAGWIHRKGLPESLVQVLAIDPVQRTPAQAESIRAYYLEHAESIIAHQGKIAAAEAERVKVEEACVQTVVTIPVEPREIRILPRGDWMNDSGEVVQPAIPEFLGSIDTGGRRANRLDLAGWLCEPDNVLTSRTMTNRLWYLMFGRGICSSVDDFGGQGTYPSHPDLLDWLAMEFVESGWDIKQTLRTIVTSATYRQSSKPTPELRDEDPYNEWFARQGRFRLDAEMVRDNALAISGLLVERIGGVSAKPYQPGGYYAQLNFPARKYQADSGDNQYRRGVYTHWQRTFLHPMLKAFDAPSREECTAARARSNTPLQALTLLNDPTFVEAARVFAARIMRECPDKASRIDWAYRQALSHPVEPEVADELQQIYDQHFAHYCDHPEEAAMLIAEGDAPAAPEFNPAELAAWTSVSRVILNLHETLNRY